jgi:SapC
MSGSTHWFRFIKERHGDVRLLPGIDLNAFAAVNHVMLGLHEITDAAADYPLVFMKDGDSGQFRLTALFGLSPNANTYFDGALWQAVYLPQEALAAPFRIAGGDQTLCINEASALVTTDTGDALFDDNGNETPALLRIRTMLDNLETGRKAANQLISALLPLDLVRPVAVTVHHESRPPELIQGLYSISPLQLKAAAPDVLLGLHARDYLQPIYTIIQSLVQFNRIRQLHNLRAEDRIASFDLVMEHG